MEKFINEENLRILWKKCKEHFVEKNNSGGNDNDNLPPVGKTLEEYTWAEISAISTAGKAADYFAIGDTKSIILNGQVGDYATYDNTSFHVYILGINHNKEIQGEGITFGCFMKESSLYPIILVSEWNKHSNTGQKYFNVNHWGGKNYGGWAGCDLRYDILGSTNVAPSDYGSETTINRVGYNATSTCATNPIANTLMAALPADLRAVMKPITIYSDNVGGGNTEASSITSTSDYLPLLSEVEIANSIKACNQYEQTFQKQYQYYADGNSVIKNRLDNNSGGSYWLRSPSVKPRNSLTNTSFCICGNNGSIGNYETEYSIGISPIFMV